MYTFSVFAKADQLSWLQIASSNVIYYSSRFHGFWFDLNGVIGQVDAAFDGGATMQSVGNGWYRCAVSFTTDATDTQGSLRVCVADDDNGTVVDLDGTSSILIYGAQFEAGAFVTSYIKSNSGSTTTRSADVASIPVADFGYNADEGSVVIESQHFTTESSVSKPQALL